MHLADRALRGRMSGTSTGAAARAQPAAARRSTAPLGPRRGLLFPPPSAAPEAHPEQHTQQLPQQQQQAPWPGAAAALNAPEAPQPHRPRRWRVRRAGRGDAESVGAVCGAAFGSSALPGLEDSPMIQGLEARYGVAITKEVSEKLMSALELKDKATLEARSYRKEREAALLRAQLRTLQGLPASFPTESPSDLRLQQRWQRCRQFACLVAEDAATGDIVGCCTLSMMQPEALLPPPFPSSAPHRLYISNMAVAPTARRGGAASSLLAAAVRAAARWGEPSVWLHVGTQNAAARELYSRAGFRPEKGSAATAASNIIPGPWSQTLMALPLAAIGGGQPGGWLRRWAAALEAAESGETAAAAAAAGGGAAAAVAAAAAASSDGGEGSESSSSSNSNGGGSSNGGGAFAWQQLVADELRSAGQQQQQQPPPAAP